MCVFVCVCVCVCVRVCVCVITLVPAAGKSHGATRAPADEKASASRQSEGGTSKVRPPSADITPYSGTSLIRNSPPLGPYGTHIPRTLRWSWEGGCFLSGERTAPV